MKKNIVLEIFFIYLNIKKGIAKESVEMTKIPDLFQTGVSV